MATGNFTKEELGRLINLRVFERDLPTVLRYRTKSELLGMADEGILVYNSRNQVFEDRYDSTVSIPLSGPAYTAATLESDDDFEQDPDFEEVSLTSADIEQFSALDAQPDALTQLQELQQQSQPEPEPQSVPTFDPEAALQQLAEEEEDKYNSRIVPWYDNDPSYDPDFQEQFQTQMQVAEQAAQTQDLNLSLDFPYQDPDGYTSPQQATAQYAINVPKTDEQIYAEQLAQLDHLKASQVQDLPSHFQEAGNSRDIITNAEVFDAQAERAFELLKAKAFQQAHSLPTHTNPFHSDATTGIASVDAARRYGIDDTPGPMDSEYSKIRKEIKEQNYNVITLNPIMQGDLLKDSERIFGSKFFIGFVPGSPANKDKGVVEPVNARSYRDFVTAIVAGITPTFEYNENTLKEDLKRGVKVLKNGNSFARDLTALVRDLEALSMRAVQQPQQSLSPTGEEQIKRELQEEYRRISEETNQKIAEAQKRKDMESCPDGTPQGTSGCLERKGMTPDQYFNKELEIYAAEMTRMQKSAEATAAAKILSQTPPTPSPSPAGSQRYKSIYQTSLLVDKEGVLQNIVYFYYINIDSRAGQQRSGFDDRDTYTEVRSMIIPATIVSSIRSRLSVNSLRYMAELSEIAAAYSDSAVKELAAARSCASTTQFAKVKSRYPDYLDYMKFSQQFQVPHLTLPGGTQIEKNKAAAETKFWSSSNFKKVTNGFMDNLRTNIDNATGRLMDYTVHKDDKIEYGVDPNSGEAVYYIVNNSEGTSPLANLALSSDGPLKNSISAERIIEDNESLSGTFSSNYAENKNALREGMVIRVARQSTPSVEPDAFIKNATGKEMAEVFKEAFTEPFLNKLCPATIPERLFECLYPSDCRDLIKYIGLWRTRDILENFIHLDIFDDRNGLLNAMEEWDDVIQNSYNFKAVSFNGNGLLRSGEFDGNLLFPKGADKISVSMQIKTTTAANRINQIPDQRAINAGREKHIFSIPGTLSMIKDAGGKIVIEITSPEGETVRYRTKDGAEDIFDGKFHQIGFSWTGPIGELIIVVDGAILPTQRYTGFGFRGPLAVSNSSQVVFCSLSPEKSSKGFAGQLDEVCIFNDVLTPDQWRKMSTINSVRNLQTDGMMFEATAWWRMGDSVDDRLETQGGRRKNAKIKDLISSIDVSPIPTSSPEDQKIVVVRDFRAQDEDKFIDIINRNTNITKFCSEILKWIKELINTNFDFEKIKEDFAQWVTPRNFPKDPQFDIKLFVNGALLENVIKLFATTLLKIAEQYLLNCDNWKSLLQAATKGTVNMNTESFQSAFAQMGDQSPLTDFINNYDDPDYWNRAVFSSDSITANFTKQLESTFLSSAGVSYGSDRAPTTLNFGSIVSVPSRAGLQDPNRGDRTSNAGPDALPWHEGTQLLIEDESRSALDRTTTIYIIQDTMSQLQPPQVLELFSGDASIDTLEEVEAIVRENFTDSQDVVDVNSISTLFGTIGSSMGLQDAIEQLINASQTLAEILPSAGTYCGPSRSFRERLGLPSDRASAIDTIRGMLDFADMKFPQGQCSLPIPLTEFERTALNNTIGAAYSSVLQAYDNDLILHKLGMTSVGQSSKTIPKVLWKGENVRKKVTNQDYFLGLCPMPGSSENNGELFEWRDVKIETTVINPEFETAVSQGYIPLKEDGTVDGTPNGGVVETDWWAWGWPDKRPPRPVKEGEDVRNLGPGKALGPYTDYENPNAIINEVRVEIGGDLANALSGDAASFALNTSTDDNRRPRYDTERENQYAQRGLYDIESKNRATLLGTALYPGAKDMSILADSLTDVQIQTQYGSSLTGIKYLNFEKKITDPNSWNAQIEFSLSQDLKEAVIQSGYAETPTVCDDDGNLVAAREEPYTPQENVFGHITEQQNQNLNTSSEELKINVYDGVYREALTAILFKVADSPLLKPVPNSQGPNNEPLLGINFVDFQTTPRMIDMRTFAEQVAEDYEALLGCQDTMSEEPIYKALKTSVSRMLARICIVELVMRGVVPFSQLYLSKKDPVIKSLLMVKLKEDMQLFLSPAQQSGVKAKIVKEFNYLANTSAIEAPPVNESQFESEWERAMEYYFEEEFNAVTNRIKEMVHGECIPKQDASDQDIDRSMYMAIIKYAKERGRNLKIETYAVNSDGLRIDGFSFSSPSTEIPGAQIVTALTYSYNNERILLTSVKENYDELRARLGLDDDSLECTPNSRYDSEGSTTTEADHFHTYTIDEFGNGVTTALTPAPGIDPASMEPHTHAIASYAVVPRVLDTGEVAHVHALVQRAEESEIREASDQERIEEFMSNRLTEESDFKILFDFCFDLREVSSFVLLYCILSSENQISYRAFSNTKKAILQMFNWLWQEGPAAEPCEVGVQKEFSPDMTALFPNLGDAFLNPQYLLSLLLAPLMTYRGWSKTADPHVFITTTAMDALEMPICPVWEKRNVPNPFDNNEIKCRDIPTWPGTRPLDNLFVNTYIPAPVVELGVAGLVTLAPTIVGLPPFFPTPFGAVYYGAVSPLIWVMRDLPRLLQLIQKDALSQQNLASIGLNVSPVSCELPTETGAGSEESKEQDCPDIKTMDDTILDISSAECQD